jgi:hypothetical protein
MTKAANAVVAKVAAIASVATQYAGARFGVMLPKWLMDDVAADAFDFVLCVRHGYTWVPTTRLTVVPDKWVQPTRRPADLSVGPTNLVGNPHDLLKTFQKISQTT